VTNIFRNVTTPRNSYYGLCRHAVSIRPSVTFLYSVETNKHIQFFHHQVATTFKIFHTNQTSWQYSDGNPLTGASNAGGICRNRDSEPIWLHRVLSTLRPQDVINKAPLWHLSVVVSGGVCWWQETTTKCLWQEVSTLSQRQQNNSDKSVVYVTNNKRLCSTFCTIEANYCQTRSTARPRCDSRATCYL